MPNQPCEIIVILNAIGKYLVVPSIASFTAIYIYKLGRRHKTIKEFKNTFLDEKYKITTSRTIQNFGSQENAIINLNGIIKDADISTIRALWEDYKKAESQCRQTVSPGNGSVYIHYGDHKPKILSKIDKIINYLK